MKKLYAILLFSVVLLPIIWNGISFLHYLVEHTHALCENEADHHHATVDDCLSICQISQEQDQNHLLTKAEFYELKQCITTDYPFNTLPRLSTDEVLNSVFKLHQGRIFSKDIFHPPILS